MLGHKKNENTTASVRIVTAEAFFIVRFEGGFSSEKILGKAV